MNQEHGLSITVNAHAKINLALAVLGKRSDGYHEVDMVLQGLELADNIILTLEETGLRVCCNHQGVPEGEDNLAWRAARQLWQDYNLPTDCGVTIKIVKKIPVAAGLAGGSADAAATLLGLNQLMGLGLTVAELIQIGSKLGSDIPFCIIGGTARAQGRGERLTILPRFAGYWLVLIKPYGQLATGEVYGRFRETVQSSAVLVASMVQSLVVGDCERVIQGMVNDLELVAAQMEPDIKLARQDLIQAGARAVLMSGSGPTVYGLANDEQHAKQIVSRLQGDYEAILVTRTR